jgi:hypothetical protein
LLGLLILTFAFLRLLLASRFGHTAASKQRAAHVARFKIRPLTSSPRSRSPARSPIAGYRCGAFDSSIEMLSRHQSANVADGQPGGAGNLFGAIGRVRVRPAAGLFSALTKHWLLLSGGFDRRGHAAARVGSRVGQLAGAAGKDATCLKRSSPRASDAAVSAGRDEVSSS